MRHPFFAVIVLALTSLCAARQPQSTSPALPDAQFPLVFDFNQSSQRWANQSPIDAHSVSEWSRHAGRRKGGIHMKGVGGGPDQLRIWRKVIHNPPGGRRLHVQAWVRGVGVENVALVCMQARTPASEHLAGFATTQLEMPLRGDFGWSKVGTTLDVPHICRNVQILLMLVGNGEVWFDDVRVELGGEGAFVGPGLFHVRGAFTIASDQPTAIVRLPVPLDTRDQTPVTYELDVTPRDRFARARLFERSPGNWVNELTLKNLTPNGTDTLVEWSSIVLGSPSSFIDAPTEAAIPPEWPKDVQQWLRATACVQSDNERIISIAKQVRGGSSDVMTILRSTLERVRTIYSGLTGEAVSLDAVAALERSTTGAGAANLVASLLRANNIPARLVAGYPSWSGPLTTHFIVECFVPGYGWYPIESTQLIAPWDSHRQINVAIVSPDDEDRSGSRPAAPLAGIPYMAVTEHEPSNAPIRTAGVIQGPQPGSDHVCVPIRNFPNTVSRERWNAMREHASARWRQWQKNGELGVGAAAARSVEWFRNAEMEAIEAHLIGD